MVRSHPWGCTDLTSHQQKATAKDRAVESKVSHGSSSQIHTSRARHYPDALLNHSVSLARQAPPAARVNDSPVPRLFTRQRHLLGLLDALGGNVGNLDFQKLLFLYCQDLASSDSSATPPGFYHFVPYQYGAFSFTSYSDRRKLVDKSILANHDRRWILTEVGRKIVSDDQLSLQRAFADRFGHLRGNSLIAKTYRDFPYYATRSTIATNVLQDDHDALQRIAVMRPKARQAGLFTIGYQDRALESFLNALLEESVTLLCDVRRNAISRKYGFSKGTLSRACERVGIGYEHLPELGIASRLRRRVKSETDLAFLFRTYKTQSLPAHPDALQRIRSWLDSGESVALICYERDPRHCHRHCVADALRDTLPVLHAGTAPSRQQVDRSSLLTHL